MTSIVTEKLLNRLLEAEGSEAAPFDSFFHDELSEASFIQVGTLVEAAHTVRGSSAYWIASILRIEGHRAKLGWLGAETNSNGGFWRNWAYSAKPRGGELDLRLHPVGYAKRDKKGFRPPIGLEKAVRDLGDDLRQQIMNRITLPDDFQNFLADCNHSSFRKGIRCEARDIYKVSTVRPAEVIDTTGRMVRLRYSPPPKKRRPYCTFHEASDDLQEPGWAAAFGRPIEASREYKKESLKQFIRFREPLPDDHDDPIKMTFINRTFAAALDESPAEVGMIVEFIDPLSPGLHVGKIDKVMPNYFVMISPVAERVKDPVCYHMGSGHVLYPGFAKAYKFEAYLHPKNFSYDGAKCLSQNAFKPNLPGNDDFKPRQWIEVDALPGSGDIYLARIKDARSHLLLVEFEGYPDSRHDQFFPKGSENLFPLGWCEAHSYPLLYKKPPN